MDFQRDSIRPLSNYETYLVVKQIHETNNERETNKRGKKGQNRTLEHCNFGLNTVTYETLKYLEQTPCIHQDRTILTQFYHEAKRFELKKHEILQILNLRPTTPVELQLIIEDSETRLTEAQSNELIDLIRTQLAPLGGVIETDAICFSSEKNKKEMSSKQELQLRIKSFGYDLNPFTSKETLSNLLSLHSKALEKGVDVAKLNDHQLRCNLNEHNIVAGPVIGHTRAIYQRKLLEVITNENSEGADDEAEGEGEDEFHTPPIPDDGVVTRSGRTLFLHTN